MTRAAEPLECDLCTHGAGIDACLPPAPPANSGGLPIHWAACAHRRHHGAFARVRRPCSYHVLTTRFVGDVQLCADWHREGHGGNIRQASTRHIQRPLACAHAELSFRPQHMSRGGQSSQPQQLAQQVGLPGAFLKPPGCSPRFILTSRTRRLDFSGGSGRPEDERHFHSRGQPEACDGGGPRVLQGRHAGAHFK